MYAEWERELTQKRELKCLEDTLSIKDFMNCAIFDDVVVIERERGVGKCRILGMKICTIKFIQTVKWAEKDANFDSKLNQLFWLKNTLILD